MNGFPPGFLWGVATAGHQTEGGNTTSDTWFLESVTPTVFREPSGAACDSWRLWATDLDLAAGLGLTAFRFSVEWARVEPVEGEFAEAALDHYESIVDGCGARGLAPVVTLNHFTAPHWFAARGGWLDPRAPELFARYVDRVIARFGDRISFAVTLNEPNLPRLLDWMGLPAAIRSLERATLTGAAARARVPRYRVANVVLPEEFDAIADGMASGHRAAKAAVRSRRPNLPVGLSLAVVDDCVVGDDPSVRDANGPRCTPDGWTSRAMTTSSGYRTTSGSGTTRPVWCLRPTSRPVTTWARRSSRPPSPGRSGTSSCRRRFRYS